MEVVEPPRFTVQSPDSPRGSTRGSPRSSRRGPRSARSQRDAESVKRDHYLAPPPPPPRPRRRGELTEELKRSPLNGAPFSFEKFRQPVASDRPQTSRAPVVTRSSAGFQAQTRPRRYKRPSEEHQYLDRVGTLGHSEKAFYDDLRNKYRNKYSTAPYHRDQFANREKSIIRGIDRQVYRRNCEIRARRIETREHDEAVRRADAIALFKADEIFCRADPSLRIIPSGDRRSSDIDGRRIYI